MLVLTRNVRETIVLYDTREGTPQPITITIVRLRGGTAKIGVTAPQHIRVVRGELAVESLANHPTEEAPEKPEKEPTNRESNSPNSGPSP